MKAILEDPLLFFMLILAVCFMLLNLTPPPPTPTPDVQASEPAGEMNHE